MVSNSGPDGVPPKGMSGHLSTRTGTALGSPNPAGSNSQRWLWQDAQLGSTRQGGYVFFVFQIFQQTTAVTQGIRLPGAVYQIPQERPTAGSFGFVSRTRLLGVTTGRWPRPQPRVAPASRLRGDSPDTTGSEELFALTAWEVLGNTTGGPFLRKR